MTTASSTLRVRSMAIASCRRFSFTWIFKQLADAEEKKPPTRCSSRQSDPHGKLSLRLQQRARSGGPFSAARDRPCAGGGSRQREGLEKVSGADLTNKVGTAANRKSAGQPIMLVVEKSRDDAPARMPA